MRDDLTNERMKHQTLENSCHDLERRFEVEKSINQQMKKDFTNERTKNQMLENSFCDLERRFEEEKSINQQIQKNLCDLKKELMEKSNVRK